MKFFAKFSQSLNSPQIFLFSVNRFLVKRNPFSYLRLGIMPFTSDTARKKSACGQLTHFSLHSRWSSHVSGTNLDWLLPGSLQGRFSSSLHHPWTKQCWAGSLRTVWGWRFIRLWLSDWVFARPVPNNDVSDVNCRPDVTCRCWAAAGERRHRRWEALRSQWSHVIPCKHAGVSCGVLAKSRSGTSPALAVYLLTSTSVLLIAGVVSHLPSSAADLCFTAGTAASLPCCSRGWQSPYPDISLILWDKQQPHDQG